MPDWAWWLIVAVIFAGMELVVFTGFIFGPLAVSAVFAAIAAGLGAGLEWQLAIFGVLGLSSMIILRPIAKKHLNAPPELRTNVDALIDQHARVLEPLTQDAPGLIRLGGENWTARPVDGIARIEPEAAVKVVQISGATAIVEPLEST